MGAPLCAEGPERPTLFAANAYYFFAIAISVLTGVALRIAGLFIAPQYKKLAYYIFTSVAEIGAFGLLPVLYAARNPSTARAFRLSPPDREMCVLAVVLAVICFFLSNYLLNLWQIAVERLGGTFTPNAFTTPENGRELWTLICVAAVLPGICEELMFRGMILGAWEAKGGGRALIAASALFVCAHMSLEALPAHLMLAFVLTLLAMCAGSIYPGVIFHVLYNGMCLASAYFVRQPELPRGVTRYENIGGAAGTIMLGMLCALFAALAAGVLAAAVHIGREKRVVFAPPTARRRRRGENVMLFAAFLTIALMLYGSAARMFGWPV
jgi:membrane protease YdiL (CAAX protease family)